MYPPHHRLLCPRPIHPQIQRGHHPRKDKSGEIRPATRQGDKAPRRVRCGGEEEEERLGAEVDGEDALLEGGESRGGEGVVADGGHDEGL